MRVAPEVIAGFCRVRSRDLFQPREGDLAALDPVKILWAFAGVESSFGLQSNPRHENGYCYNGRYFDAMLTDKWGCLAHCSYGPWQVMFTNFPPGVSPIPLLPMADGHVASDMSAMACVSLLNRALARGAKTVVDLVTYYNGPANVPEYAKKFLASYDRPMPQYADPVLA